MTTTTYNWEAIRDLADDLELLATDVARTSDDHGPRHWRDVARLGLALWAEGIEINHDDMVIVLLFAMLHDTQRHNEFEDPEHGDRAAAVASRLGNSGRLLDWLDNDRFGRLTQALVGHDRGEVMDPYDDVAVATCWDSDRLTIGRVGIKVDPAYLSNPEAKTPVAIMGAEAVRRATRDFSWQDIIKAYENLEPLDVLHPAMPPQHAVEYREARKAHGEALHPDLTVVESKAGPSVVTHRYMHDLYMGPTAHALYNARFISLTHAIEEAWENNEWDRFVALHAKPFQLDALREAIPFMEPEDIAEVAASVWSHSENIWQQEGEWAEVWRAARDNGHASHAMDEDEQRALEALPEEVTVYRGFNRRGREVAMSWSVSRDQAEWFAHRWARAESVAPQVAVATVKRDRIVAYLAARGEDEVIVLPEDLTIDEIYEVGAR